MRDSKNEGIVKDESNCFKELNNFITKLFNEIQKEKDELVLNYNKNNEILEDIEAKLLVLDHDISYNDNIFNPNYSYEENEVKIKNLNNDKDVIIKENIELQNKIKIVNYKINEVDNIISKVKNRGYKEFLDNCNGNIKYKIEILRSQEFERKRIARDIHDTVIQKLTNLIHKTEFTLKVMDVDSVRAKLELMTISNNLRDAIEEMRNIIYNLRPMAFDDIGIDVIIERELSKIKEMGIDVKYDVEGEDDNVDQIVQLTLIRIIQEACNNAIKHSNFTKFHVKIIYTDHSIEVYIRDNGKGFKISDNNGIIFESKSGFGLSMMRERVYLLSGIINFKSNTKEGTEIYVKVPKCFREDMKNAD